MWICIAPRCDHTSKVLRYGSGSQGISQCYLHTPHSSANRMNHTCLFLPSRSCLWGLGSADPAFACLPWILALDVNVMVSRYQNLHSMV